MTAACWVCEGAGALDGCEECGLASPVAVDGAPGRTERYTPPKRFEEPDGFAQWLGRHCIGADVAVPKALTPRRELLAKIFAALSETHHDIPVLLKGMEVGEPERGLTLAWSWITAELMNEQEREENGPSDDELYNGFGVEGGIPYSPQESD
jgi:hypothetical protein